jgi:hypothetical protein
MTKNTSIEITGKIVNLLSPLASEERMRIIQASLTLLGETLTALPKGATGGQDEPENAYPVRARAWMKQYAISSENIEQVLHVAEGTAEVIAATVPGKNNKEQTFNAYILTGIAKLFATGEPVFEDKSARSLCELSGCYDSANHAAHMKNKGNEFTGSKDKGWTLTSPGLKRGANLVKELNK